MAIPGRDPSRDKPRTSGQGRTRTSDTPVFSRVLYQLSYLARRPIVADLFRVECPPGRAPVQAAPRPSAL